MDVYRLLQLARDFATASPSQPRLHWPPMAASLPAWFSRWRLLVTGPSTNCRCRKVREIEATGMLTLLYQADGGTSYVSFSRPTEVIEDQDRKRSSWTPGHDL
jgi:hypothetical protein